MPTYTYECKKCGHQQDVFHSITATPKVKCEACGAAGMKRCLGTGAGIIFKGSGFYETDYKRNGNGKASSAPSESKSEAKSETKSESKSDSAKTSSKSSSDK